MKEKISNAEILDEPMACKLLRKDQILMVNGCDRKILLPPWVVRKYLEGMADE